MADLTAASFALPMLKTQVSQNRESENMSQSKGRKSIFITGAGSGIGRATAQLFASRGWFCGLYDMNEAGIEETATKMPVDSYCTGVFDVRDREGWAKAVTAFGDSTGGQMHALFNNAGIGRFGPFADIPQDEADLVVDVNLKGVLNGIYASLPLLETTLGSRIVNTASTAGLIGSPRLAVYSATKFAVRGLSEALDVEFSAKNIRVIALCPWFVETPILDMGASDGANNQMRAGLKGLEIYPVEMAADRTWDAFHGEDTIVKVGKAADRAHFMSRFFPGYLKKQMLKSVQR
jgi:NAD(P)-dependent dehydrogenase (short-subunit alcohol dehydrogenase family)